MNVNIDVPESVGRSVVNDALTQEISSLNKEMEKAKGPLEQLEKKMASAGCMDKVPQKLKKENLEKQEGLKKKVADVDVVIVNFEKLLSLEEKPIPQSYIDTFAHHYNPPQACNISNGSHRRLMWRRSSPIELIVEYQVMDTSINREIIVSSESGPRAFWAASDDQGPYTSEVL